MKNNNTIFSGEGYDIGHGGGNYINISYPEGSHVIGELFDRTFVVKRDLDAHLMKKWNALGVNSDILDSGIVDSVVFDIKGQGMHALTVTEIKSHGRVFSANDYDKQYFIDVDYILKRK